MNILFWLTPKEKVAFVHDDSTLRQVLEKMEIYRYSSIPILDHEGHYVGTIREGDLLWYLKARKFNLKMAEMIKIDNVPRNKDNQKITVDTQMEDIFSVATQQNFIPVVDDYDYFIGIITRKSIFEYMTEKKK